MSRGWSFRPLILFWSVLLGLSAAGAVALQLIGPVRPGRQAGPPRAAMPAAPSAAPASTPPSRSNPVPPLPVTAQSIPEPDPALQEPAIDLPDRVLPRISDAGLTPARLYAAAFDPAERHPRVALVIDGAGLDRDLTEQAMRSLPTAIDFAYSAYAPTAAAARLAEFGRRQGRECLVSIPMEPSGFPMTEEGDKSLLMGADPAQNRANLDWALSNVQGCVGATGGSDGLNGERFAESRLAYGDVLAAVGRRGLIYLDPRPGVPPPEDMPAGQQIPRDVDIVVTSAAADEPAGAQTIDENLARLEKIAAVRGAAIGLAGPPTPVLLERVSIWAQGLAARGVVLAPLTAMPRPRPAAP